MRVSLDKHLLFSKAERNDLISDSGTVLQEERELRTKRLVVDSAQVAEPSSFELKALDVVHGQPAPVYFFHTILHNQVFKGLIDISSRVRWEVKLEGVGCLEIFHGLNEPLSLLHQTFSIRGQ